MHQSTHKTTLALVSLLLLAALAGCGGGGSAAITSSNSGNSPADSLPSGSVVISGTAAQGQVLTATNTLADSDTLGAFSYQWLADGVLISGATNSTLTLAVEQVGHVIKVVISYVDGKGNHDSATSAATAPVVYATSNLQGIWTPGSIGNASASLVVLGNGASYALSNGAPLQLFSAALQGTATGYAGSGMRYVAGATGAPAAVAYTAAVTSKTTLTGSLTPAGEAAQPFSFVYNPSFDTPALLSDLAGGWSGARDGGTVTQVWSISSTGAVGGVSTGGCTYAGAVVVHTENTLPVGLYDLTLSEQCANVKTQYVGVVTLNGAKTTASFAYTSADGSAGHFLVASKH